jgi:hypothetical protein
MTASNLRRTMSEPPTKTCIFPGCDRPAVPPNPLGGPQPSFCDLEEHNALTAHQARQRLLGETRSEPDRSDGVGTSA